MDIFKTKFSRENASFETRELNLWISISASVYMVQKVAVKREVEADDWKTLSVNPAVNGDLFRIREG